MDKNKYLIENLVEIISHSGAIAILKSLKKSSKPLKQIELINRTKLDKTIVWRRIKELLDFGLIALTTIRDTPTGSKAYELTPLGKKIVKHIEEMEKEFERYHKGLSKGRKFIEEVMEEE